MKSLKDFSDEELAQELEKRKNDNAYDLAKKWQNELETQAKIILEAMKSYNEIRRKSGGTVICDTDSIVEEFRKSDFFMYDDNHDDNDWNSSGCSF